MTEQRVEYLEHATAAANALAGVSRAARESGLEVDLVHLVALRASQINGCSYCVDLHYRDAVVAGVAARTLNAVAAWREAPFFSARQRAALAWTETLTRIETGGAPDDAFAAVAAHFEDAELANLTFAVAAINAWNRVAVGFRKGPDPA